MSEMLGAAAWAVERGWCVFPLAGKRPRTEHGVLDASRDFDHVDRWWTRWPRAGIGLACGPISGVWLLDVDGPAGRDSLASLEATHAPLPHTVRVLTRRGAHHLFRWPDGAGIGNSAGTRLGAGLDIRGEGGYGVMPPSRHPSGALYRWDPEAHPDEIPVALAPEWLVARVKRPEPAPPRETPVLPLLPRQPSRGYVAAAVEREALELAKAPQGTRNDRLNLAAYALARLVGQGIADEAAVRRALVLGARAAGLSDIEIQRTIRSAFRGRGVG